MRCTVATAVLELLHIPPETELDNVDDAPGQAEAILVIEPSVPPDTLMVTVAVLVYPPVVPVTV
ncbi:MAG: hypothetical protein H7257_04380 [Taibaiella sp.]|nr:hypothetical protein [Taibaiella sp.]